MRWWVRKKGPRRADRTVVHWVSTAARWVVGMVAWTVVQKVRKRVGRWVGWMVPPMAV